MKKLLVTAFLLSIFMACNDKCCTDIDLDIQLSFVNADDEDLLDTNLENSIRSDEINLYYLINGQKVRVIDNQIDRSENFNVSYSEYFKKNVLHLVVSHHLDENNQSITFLELNQNDTDTIKCSIIERGNVTFINTVWYNDQLIITNQQDGDHAVIKK